MRNVVQRDLHALFESPDWGSVDGESESWHELAGMRIRVVGDDRGLLRAWSSLPVESSNREDWALARSLDVVFYENSLPQSDQLESGWFCSADHRYVGSRRQAVSAMLDRSKALLRVSIAGEPSAEEVGKPLLFELIHWLRDRDLDVIHGALVVDGSSSVLLGGRGGTGKSTTVLSCLGEGWGLVGDDYLAIDATGVCWSIYRSIWLDREWLKRFPQFREQVVASGDKQLLFALDVVPRATPSVVVLPRRSQQQSLVRCSPRQAFLRMAPSTTLLLPGNKERRLDRLGLVVSRSPCWDLELGESLRQLPSLLNALSAQNHSPNTRVR